jgi:oligopeptide/dipeptide ABC transporter ATP-binding protein
MYAGKIMEVARKKDILDNPHHPYTVGLRDCIPSLGQKREHLFSIPGQPPDLLDPPAGCAFVPRCNRAEERCKDINPPTFTVGDDHIVNCWLYHD